MRISPLDWAEFLTARRCVAHLLSALSLSPSPHRLSVSPSDPDRQSVHESSPERQQRRRRRFKGRKKDPETGRPHYHKCSQGPLFGRFRSSKKYVATRTCKLLHKCKHNIRSFERICQCDNLKFRAAWDIRNHVNFHAIQVSRFP